MKYTGEYGTYYGSRTGKKGRGTTLLDIVVLIVTVIAAGMLLSAYLARYINPETNWVFAFAGLAAPLLFVVNIILALYWIVRWKYFVVIPAVVVLAGAGYLPLFFRPTLSKHYEGETKGTLVVMTYNVMGFLYEEEEGRMVTSIDSIGQIVSAHKPDILCMQEFQARSADQKHRIDSTLGMPYNRVKYKKENSRGGGWGLAVYSNYPITGSGIMDFPESNNSAMWVDVVVHGDTLRVFNNHLQTTSVNTSDREFIQNQEFLLPTPEREERVRGIASKLRRNYRIRAHQADTLAPVIHDSPHRLIVCGDFNDTPLSYVYFRIRGRLADTFAEKGHGINSNTFRGLYNLFRIDYILHSRDIKALQYDAPASEFSDHKAVVARLKLPE